MVFVVIVLSTLADLTARSFVLVLLTWLLLMVTLLASAAATGDEFIVVAAGADAGSDPRTERTPAKPSLPEKKLNFYSQSHLILFKIILLIDI